MTEHTADSPHHPSLDRRRFIGATAAGGAAAWVAPAMLRVSVAGAASPVSGSGEVRGRVVDARTGDPISAVTVTVLATGQSAATDPSGAYLISNVPAGAQTVQATAGGYATATQPANVPAGGAATANFSLSAVGDIRVVLAWNTLESDLDLHLSGPDGRGGRFHAYYNDQSPEPHVSLDRDDTDGEGPETTTITIDGSAYVPGEYRVWVHDFPLGSDDQNFIGAEAQVTFFDRVQQRAQYAPTDPGHTGDQNDRIWRVFDFVIDASGAVTAINPQLTFAPGSSGTVY